MAVTHATATRQAMADAALNLINGGSGDPTGDLTFVTSADAILCICNFSATAFGATNGSGVATANAISSGTVSGSGTIAKALFRNKSNTEILRCAVSTSGSDINLSSVTVNTNDTISISSLTYTAPT